MSNWRKIVDKPKEYFTGDSSPYCIEPGCGKRLTPMEYLYSSRCFSCNANYNQMERAKAKLTDRYIYKITLYKWNANNNTWDEKYSEVITLEQYNKKPHSEDFKDDHSRTFYRYDLFIDYQCTDTIYSYSPNLFL